MLLGMFELVGFLFHTCRPWPDVISAYNGANRGSLVVMESLGKGDASIIAISEDVVAHVKIGLEQKQDNTSGLRK